MYFILFDLIFARLQTMPGGGVSAYVASKVIKTTQLFLKFFFDALSSATKLPAAFVRYDTATILSQVQSTTLNN